MFVRKKKNRSGSTSVIVVEKTSNKYKEHITIGISSDEEEIERLVRQGKEWIKKYQSRHSPELDLYGEESEAKRQESENMLAFLSNIENILVNGDQLILDRIFDKLNHTQQEKVQDISVHHTRKLLGGNIGVMFYDVTTLYFEADREDDMRKTGFSKEGRHKNPQIILGLLVSLNGYPLAYCIHEGNRYEGHTMMPVIEEFVSKYELDDFVIVADSGLMNEQNILDMEKNGYKYIIGAKIKNESNVIKQWILEQKKIDRQMHEYDKGNGRRLLVGYTSDRAKKDAYSREKGIRRLEKSYTSQNS